MRRRPAELDLCAWLQDCDPLWLTSSDGTRFTFVGAQDIVSGRVAAEDAFAPPDAAATGATTPTSPHFPAGFGPPKQGAGRREPPTLSDTPTVRASLACMAVEGALRALSDGQQQHENMAARVQNA